MIMIVVFMTWLQFGFSTPTLILDSYGQVPRAPFVSSSTPDTLAIEGLAPNTKAVNEFVAKPQSSVRAIVVFDGLVDLYAGGILQKNIVVTDSTTTTMSKLVSEIHDTAWISEFSPGVFELKAALIFQPGIGLLATSPATKSILMKDQPSVFLMLNGPSTSRLSGVRVDTYDRPRHWLGALHPRPFVLFLGDAIATIDHSTFANLGWDWLDSYGLTFFNVTSGSVTNSLVEHNFIGFYCQQTVNFTVANSHFLRSYLYGLDPHTDSSHLTIRDNFAEFNAAHGIIFSVHVRDSFVDRNVSKYNGESGIVMDARSTGNTISHNIVQFNRGDGIDLTRGSHGSKVIGNTVTHNRVGLFVAEASDPKVVKSNVFKHNVLTSEGYVVDSTQNSVELRDDGMRLIPPHKWSWIFKLVLWPFCAVLLAVVLIVRRVELKRLGRRFPIEGAVPPSDLKKSIGRYRFHVLQLNRASDSSRPITVLPPLVFIGPPSTQLDVVSHVVDSRVPREIEYDESGTAGTSNATVGPKLWWRRRIEHVDDQFVYDE